MPYPIKKEAERRRSQDPISGKARHGELRPVKIPNGKSDWHPRAKAWYNSLKTSGQSDYFQDSDWAKALIVADLITYCYENKHHRMAMMWSEITSMMASLGTSEGDRRQVMRVELEFPAEEELSEAEEAQDMYAAMLGIVGKK